MNGFTPSSQATRSEITAATQTSATVLTGPGHRTGPGYSVQANLMRNETIWPAMAQAYEGATGDLQAIRGTEVTIEGEEHLYALALRSAAWEYSDWIILDVGTGAAVLEAY